MLYPILQARMRLGAMRAVVVAQQVVEQPGISLRFGLRFMEVIQGLVGLFPRAEGPLHFALRAGRGAAAIVAAGHMGLHLDPQVDTHGLTPVALAKEVCICLEGCMPSNSL